MEYEIQPKTCHGHNYYCASKKYQFYSTATATVGAFGLGTVLAWSSPAIPNIERTPSTAKYNVDLSSNPGAKAWLGSIATLGALFSGPLAGYLCTKLGRKTSMLLITSPFILGWLLITYSKSLSTMLIGRFMTGFCGGAISLLAPIFIGETVQSCQRGMLASMFQVMIVSGILFAYTFGAFLTWQWLSLVCGFVPLVFIVFMIFMPESPWYTLVQGQIQDATDALCWLRGTEDPELVQDELRDIQKNVQETCNGTPFTFREFVYSPNIYKPTIMTTMILIFQQLSGINTVIFYTNDLVNLENIQLNIDTLRIIMGSIQLIITILSALLVDRLGRRKLLLTSSIIMFLTLTCLGTYFQLVSINYKPSTFLLNDWIPSVLILILICAFSIGYGGIPWILACELLNRRRGIEFTASISTAAHWTAAFIVTILFEISSSSKSDAPAEDGRWIYFVHGFICFIATIFVYKFLPETKGKSLDEIQQLFE